MLIPFRISVPFVGFIMEHSMSKVVVFPAPFGPRSPKISLSSMVSLNSLTASVLLKRLVKPSNFIKEISLTFRVQTDKSFRELCELRSTRYDQEGPSQGDIFSSLHPALRPGVRARSLTRSS